MCTCTYILCSCGLSNYVMVTLFHSNIHSMVCIQFVHGIVCDVYTCTCNKLLAEEKSLVRETVLTVYVHCTLYTLLNCPYHL